MAINTLKFKGETLELSCFESFDGWFGVTSIILTAGIGDFNKMLKAVQDYGATDHKVIGYEFGNQTHRKLQKLFDDACVKAQEIYEDKLLANS